MKNTNSEKNYFIIFLIIHSVVWSLLPLIRHLLPVDVMEGIVWGGYCDFGTHKHPPLAGWITYFVYNLFNHCEFAIYFIGQLFVVFGLWFNYKLAKLFCEEKAAICSVMILEACFAYSYISIFYGFNPNSLLMFFFPAISYFAYMAIKDNKLSDWIICGVLVGLSFLSKYQTILLVVALYIYVIFVKKFIKTVFNYKFLLSVIFAVIINVPHILWLIKNEFFSWKYFDDIVKISISNRPFTTLDFLGDQILANIGVIFVFLFLYFKFKDNRENLNFEKDKAYFIICAGYLPVIMQVLMSDIIGSRLLGTWGYVMLFMTGLTLYYFFPVKIDKKYFSLFIKFVYFTMVLTSLVYLILFSVEKNFRSLYPYEKISKDLSQIYKTETGKELKYVTGYIEFALPITIYDEKHPQIIFNTYGHKNIWVNDDDVKKSGVMIISRQPFMIYDNLVPYNSDDKSKNYQIYKFTVQNKLKQLREYLLFYKIINPVEK